MAFVKKPTGCFILAMILFLGLCLTGSPSSAVPYLQLDIAGGTYDTATQTIIAPANQFTLYAYLFDPTGQGLNQDYYISAALAPKTNDRNQESFTIRSDYFNSYNYNGTFPGVVNTVNFASDIYVDYGAPPHFDYNQLYDTGDLYEPQVFATLFKEFKFSFNAASQVSAYDTATRIPEDGTMYYATFDVDTSDLLAGDAIHFDLYTVVGKARWDGTTDYDVGDYAPFDHDAQSLDPSPQVPDASIMFLLGPGLVGLGLFGRRKFRK